MDAMTLQKMLAEGYDVNPHENGDVFLSLNGKDIEYLGHIDDDGDWTGEEKVGEVVRKDVHDQIDGTKDCGWTPEQWPMNMLVFAGLGRCEVCGALLEEEDGWLSCPVYLAGKDVAADEHTSIES